MTNIKTLVALLAGNTLCMIIDFQEKTVKTPVDGISPLDFAALQML
jgi:hypothetical protein